MSQLNIAGQRRSQCLWRPGDPELHQQTPTTTMSNDNMQTPSAEAPSISMPTNEIQYNNATNANNASNATNNAMNLDYDPQADDNYSEYEDNYYNYDVNNGWNPNLYPEGNISHAQQESTTYANQTAETDFDVNSENPLTNENVDTYYNEDPDIEYTPTPPSWQSQPTSEVYERVQTLENEVRALLHSNNTLHQSLSNIHQAISRLSMASPRHTTIDNTHEHPSSLSSSSTSVRASPTNLIKQSTMSQPNNAIPKRPTLPMSTYKLTNRGHSPKVVQFNDQHSARHQHQVPAQPNFQQIPSHPPPVQQQHQNIGTRFPRMSPTPMPTNVPYPPSNQNLPNQSMNQPMYTPFHPYSTGMMPPPWYVNPPNWMQMQMPTNQQQAPHMTQVTSKDMEIVIDYFKNKEPYLTWRSQMLLKLSQHNVYTQLTHKDPVTGTLQLNPMLQQDPMCRKENRLLFMALYKAVREHGGITVTQSISENADGFSLLKRLDAKHLGKKFNPVDQTSLVTELYKMTRKDDKSIEAFGTRFLQHYELCLYHKTPQWSVLNLGTLFITNLKMP